METGPQHGKAVGFRQAGKHQRRKKREDDRDDFANQPVVTEHHQRLEKRHGYDVGGDQTGDHKWHRQFA
ncbi:hypothetical protein [Bradyrhizobium sp. JYMT SZCCT0428]|uniref:hypothetical protein n=1 Tax=Bradyrhizobium sp. JYMT SZCCT0428 TaxID=2807673 RepID=UPI001BA9B74E|nr:hypothetical protein [Bradyrhizobium sp. JYMT SZCCT0428]MBR1151943.1 hypothetical protein [Bradyrhizobium sp. JYMT SZCCT0428]